MYVLIYIRGLPPPLQNPLYESSNQPYTQLPHGLCDCHVTCFLFLSLSMLSSLTATLAALKMLVFLE